MPLWELWAFLQICCNLLVDEQLSFSHLRAFLSVGFLKVFIIKEEVSCPMESCCSCSWFEGVLQTFSLLPVTALKFAFIPVNSLARDLCVPGGCWWSSLWNHGPTCTSSPFSPHPFPHFSKMIWASSDPSAPTLEYQPGGWQAWLQMRIPCPPWVAQLLKRHAVFERAREGGKVSRPTLLCPFRYTIVTSGVPEFGKTKPHIVSLSHRLGSVVQRSNKRQPRA